MIGYLVNDVVLIWDEVVGLQANLLVVDGPSTGETRLSQWLERNADSIGARYASELKRHYECRRSSSISKSVKKSGVLYPRISYLEQ